MDSVESVAEKLVEIIKTAEGDRVIGARLGALLKAQVADFTPLRYGCRNLRQFIRTHATEVAEESATSQDVFYILAPTSEARFQPELATATTVPYVRSPISAVYWRAYSNPSSRAELYVNKEIREIRLLENASGLLDPWVHIEKPTSDAHLAFAKRFAEAHAGTARIALEQILEAPKWYLQFSATASRLGVGSKWAAFRITELSALLERELLKFDIPMNALRQPTSSKHPVPEHGRHIHHFDEGAKAQGCHITEQALRQAIAKIVMNIPLDELRLLRLPLGAVIDSIGQK